MKILYHHRIKSMDGQFVHIEELVSQLEELGHEVHVIGPVALESSEFGSSSRALGVVRRIFPRFSYELMEFCYCFIDFARLVKSILKIRPEVIYERFNLFTPSGIWAKQLFRLPLILEVNAPLMEERASFGGLSLRQLAQWSQKYVWNGADHVITVTEVLQEIVEDYGRDTSTISVIANGVNPEEFRFVASERAFIRSSLGIGGNFVIGFTGFVREWHQLDQVLELLAGHSFAKCVLLIVGDGPAIDDLKTKASDLGMDSRLIVTGVVSRGRVAEYVAAFDVAVQPNVVGYASPLKVLEYLSMGKAIVAPRTRNICELLTDGTNATLFDEGDPQSLRMAMKKTMIDETYRRALESSARETIERRGLTWHNNALRTVELFTELLAQRDLAG